MMSDEDFFDKFRDSVIGLELPAENEDQDDDDVASHLPMRSSF